MEAPKKRKSTTRARVMASRTRWKGTARPRKATCSRPVRLARRASSSTATVAVLTPPAVEPEEPPMSMKIQHNALLLSVRFP